MLITANALEELGHGVGVYGNEDQRQHLGVKSPRRTPDQSAPHAVSVSHNVGIVGAIIQTREALLGIISRLSVPGRGNGRLDNLAGCAENATVGKRTSGCHTTRRC